MTGTLRALFCLSAVVCSWSMTTRGIGVVMSSRAESPTLYSTEPGELVSGVGGEVAPKAFGAAGETRDSVRNALAKFLTPNPKLQVPSPRRRGGGWNLVFG